MAPGADIDVYEAPNDSDDNAGFGPLDEYAAIVNNDQDQVVTTSWGLCEQAVQARYPGRPAGRELPLRAGGGAGAVDLRGGRRHGQRRLQHVRAPSPVSGQNPVSVDDPSSQPYVDRRGRHDDRRRHPAAQEHVWNDGADGGAAAAGSRCRGRCRAGSATRGSPGIVLPGSTDYTQANEVEQQFGFPQNFCRARLTGATSTTPCRMVPDVSAAGRRVHRRDHDLLEQFAGPRSRSTAAGRRSAAPRRRRRCGRGCSRCVNASAACAVEPGDGQRRRLRQPAAVCGGVEPDRLQGVVQRHHRRQQRHLTASTTAWCSRRRPGYDLATGLGSPQLTAPGGNAGLASYLCSSGQSAARPGRHGPAPAVLSTAGGTVTITGSGFENALGVPTSPGSRSATPTIRPADFTVNSNTSITATFPPAANTLPPGSPKPQDGAGPAPVVVTLKNGESSAPGAASTLAVRRRDGLVGAVPSVTGLSPYGGPETAPTPVTILGSGFAGHDEGHLRGRRRDELHRRQPLRDQRSRRPRTRRATQCCPEWRPARRRRPTSARRRCGSRTPPARARPARSCSRSRAPCPRSTRWPCSSSRRAATASSSRPRPSSTTCRRRRSRRSRPRRRIRHRSRARTASTLITIKGTGFNLLTLDWVDFGDPTLASSQNFDETFETGTEIQIVAPARVA